MVFFLLSWWAPYTVSAFEKPEIWEWVAEKLEITPDKERPLVIELEEDELEEKLVDQ